MRARLTRHPRSSSSSFTLVSSVSAALAPPSFCSSPCSLADHPRAFALSLALSIFLSLSLSWFSTLSFSISLSFSFSLVAPPVPFASGGDIYTRINPAARTRVPTYTAAGPGHLVISVTSRTFRSERQLTCNCGANGCSRMRRA